jgi:hypothetical protein
MPATELTLTSAGTTTPGSLSSIHAASSQSARVIVVAEHRLHS